MSPTFDAPSIQRQKYYLRPLESVKSELLVWEKRDAQERSRTLTEDVSRLRALENLISTEKTRLKRMQK